MKKTILIIMASSIIGFTAGAYSIINIFAVEPDLLGAPYSNTPVFANKDVVITQGNIKITIPKGATLQYRYNAKDQPYYALNIVGWPFEERPFEETKSWEYFFVEKHESQ